MIRERGDGSTITTREVGYYWVRGKPVGLIAEPELYIAQWTELGVWNLCGEGVDFPDLRFEVVSGPLRDPYHKLTREEMLERAATRVSELAVSESGMSFLGFRVWTIQQGQLDFDQLAAFFDCDRKTAVSLCLCKMPRVGTDDVSRVAARFGVGPGRLLALLEDPAFSFPPKT